MAGRAARKMEKAAARRGPPPRLRAARRPAVVPRVEVRRAFLTVPQRTLHEGLQEPRHARRPAARLFVLGGGHHDGQLLSPGRHALDEFRATHAGQSRSGIGGSDLPPSHRILIVSLPNRMTFSFQHGQGTRQGRIADRPPLAGFRGRGLAHSRHRQLPGCRTPKARQLPQEQELVGNRVRRAVQALLRGHLFPPPWLQGRAALVRDGPTRRRARRLSPCRRPYRPDANRVPPVRPKSFRTETHREAEAIGEGALGRAGTTNVRAGCRWRPATAALRSP